MTENKPKRTRREKNPPRQRLDDRQLAALDEILGKNFSKWYKATHDEQGQQLPPEQQQEKPHD